MYVVETHDLVKKYGKNVVIDHVNMHIPEGEIYGFVGDFRLLRPFLRVSEHFKNGVYVARVEFVAVNTFFVFVFVHEYLRLR